MANIDVKRLKRFTIAHSGGSTNLKEVELGSSRLYKNELVLDSTNQDYLEFPSFTLQDGQSVKQTYLFDTSNQGVDYVVFCGSQNEFLIHNNGTNFHVRDIESNNYFFTDTTVYSNKITIELTLSGGVYELFVDGVSKGTNSKIGSDIVFSQLNKRGTGTAEMKNITLYDFQLNDTTFLLREGSGNTTTSEDGITTATINTSHASGTDYINDFVWNNDVRQLNRGNNPAFRANGYELALDSANSDYLILENQIELTGDFLLEFDYDSFIDSNNQHLASNITASSTNYIQLVSAGRLVIVFNNGDNYYFDGVDTLPRTGRYKLGVERIGSTLNLLLNDSIVDTKALTTIETFSLGRLFIRNSFSFEGKVYSFSIQNETFNPIDIDSSGQIVGSSGTVATVNTSHASGLSYILETVFQKSSFALEFESANSEWLNLNQTFSIENEGDYVEFDVFLTKITPQVEILLSEGDTGLNLGKFTDGTLYIDGFLNTLIVVDGLNTIRIEILGGNKVVTLNGLSQTQGTDAFRFSQIAKRVTTYTNMQLYSLTINGTNYPFTEGLGNTTNGFDINTSHASGIDRINYGIWQKNGSVLEFDSANSDYLEINDSFTWTNTSDISLEITTIPKWESGNTILFMIGNISSPNSGYFRIRINDASNILFQYADVNNTNPQQTTVTYTNNEEINIKIEGGDLFINGVLDSSLVSQSVNIDTDFGKPTFSKYTNLPQWYLSQELKEATIQNETFPLTEERGRYIKGSNGTVGVLNTDGDVADIWDTSLNKWVSYD